jgi:hypothetical protein
VTLRGTYREAGSCVMSLRGFTLSVAIVVAITLCATASYAAGDTADSLCGESSQTSPGFRPYLPDCRAYELVSPPYKEGGLLLADPATISEDGEYAIVGVAGATSEAENESYDPNRSGDIVVYRLKRTPTGWSYAAMNPPASPYERSALLGISDDATLSKTLWGAQTVPTPHKEDIYMRSGTSEPLLVGAGEIPSLAAIDLAADEELALVGASSDLNHTIFSITNEPGSSGGHLDVWPGDTTNKKALSLYEYAYRGTPNLEPELVGVKNEGALKGSPHLNEGAELVSDCGTELGSGEGGSDYNAVSKDGATVFFTAKACGGGPVADELYARLEQTHTVAISEPSAEDCEVCNTTIEVKNASFVGASGNGEKVFFMTEQALLPGQEGTSIYAYDFAGPAASPSHPEGKITLISQAAKPEVQGVVRISKDGSHVYFVAKGLLAGANAEGQSPEAGGDNLYVYEPDLAHSGNSHVVFVATLLTAGRESEAIAEEEAIEGAAFGKAIEFWESHCPPAFSNFACFGEVEAVLAREMSALGYFDIVETLNEDKQVWQREDQRPAQSTPDGRFLVFTSSADLTADDTSDVPQIFEYDSKGGGLGEGSLARVSIGQNGSYDADGNVSRFVEAPQIPRQPFAFSDLPTSARFGLAVSDDGSKVFFTSSARLTPLAVSGEPSVFEYSDGNVYLLSDGADASLIGGGAPAVQLYGSDATGRNVFFTTADHLVPQAADTEQTLYDVREEGGFPAPALAPGCLGETCRGSSAGAPMVGSPPGTATQTAGDNVAGASGGKQKSAATTRSVRLARALKACNRSRRRSRARCRARARQRYGGQSRRGSSARSKRQATSSRRPRDGSGK